MHRSGGIFAVAIVHGVRLKGLKLGLMSNLWEQRVRHGIHRVVNNLR